MERYSRKEVIEITKPEPNWMNFNETVFYIKKTITLLEAVTTLYTVLDDIEDFERISIIDYAKAFKDNKIIDIPDERLDKINTLLKTKHIDQEISIPCFKCGDLKNLLPEEYPAWIKIPNNAYVVEDRNHRLIALALRLLEGEDIGNIRVDVFYGQLIN